VAPKEGHAAWVIERERQSNPVDETEAETLNVAEARLLKLLDPPPTERELPIAGAIVEVETQSLYPDLGRGAGARRAKTAIWRF